MNFYSDDVINHIIDNEAVEDIIPMISLFREDFYFRKLSIYPYLSYRC